MKNSIDKWNACSVSSSPGASGTAVPNITEEAVEYVAMGRSGLKVSRACLGTMNFSAEASTAGGLAATGEAEATRIIHAYIAAGGNFIDTADIYNDGESEQVTGRALRGRRDEVVLATKAFMPRGTGPNDRGLSRVHLTRALEASLRRLGTDYIDLYYCHQPDPDTPVEETMATLDGFVISGKVRYLGCSNFSAAQIVEAQWAADRRGGTPFVALQPQYSLTARAIEAEVLPVCARHGLGVAGYSPLAGGVLAGRYRRGASPDPGSRLSKLLTRPQPAAQRWAAAMLSDRGLAIAEEVRKIADGIGATPAAVALAWTAARPGITSVITGPRTEEQFGQIMAGFSLDLPADAHAHLTAVSETPQ
jgi:aryl-alcohol dehydrogenase-like predicted oxidoreductase